MTYELSVTEYKTLNDAEQILLRVIASKEEVLMTSLHAGWREISVSYFTPNHTQYTSVWAADGDNTFAGKIGRCLELKVDEEGRADQIKADRIERLRAELAALTEEIEVEHCSCAYGAQGAPVDDACPIHGLPKIEVEGV